MAPPSAGSTSRRFVLASVCCCCCLLVSARSKSDGGAAAVHGHGQKSSTADTIGRAFICLNDRYIYSGCQGSYRLGPEGTLNVPAAAAKAFCGGQCLEETSLVLRCIDGIMDSFRFYNGASVADVRFALDRGCGHGGRWGDFEVLPHLGGGDGFFHGRGSSGRSVSRNLTLLLLLLSVAATLLWWCELIN